MMSIPFRKKYCVVGAVLALFCLARPILHAAGQTTGVEFETVYRVGGEDATAATEIFGQSVAATLGEGGRLYVADGEAAKIRLFDSTGTHVRSVGREGRGPGEFVDVAEMALSAGGDSLYAYDRSQRRVSVFTAPGLKHVRDFRVDLRTMGLPSDLAWQQRKGEGKGRVLLVDHVIEQSELVHALTLAGGHARSYAPFLADLDDLPDPEIVRQQINTGFVTQLAGGDLVAVLAGPYILARLRPDGTEVWRVTDDVVPTKPWVDYIDHSEERYQSRVYPQVVGLAKLNGGRLAVSVVNWEEETSLLDVRNAEDGKLLHRQSFASSDRWLVDVAPNSDGGAGGSQLALLRDQRPAPSFHVVRYQVERNP
jgi:hypothetical protein